MKWLKRNWLKILQYIIKGFLLLICIYIIYSWFEFNGSVREKIVFLIMAVPVILLLSADFREDIIKWFKDTFKD